MRATSACCLGALAFVLAAGASAQDAPASPSPATATTSPPPEPVTPITEHNFKPFEVSAAHIIYAGFGAFVVLFACFSLFIKERLFLGEAPLAAVFGIIVGPYCLNLFDPAHWGKQRTAQPPGSILTDDITIEVLRVTIALSVFAAGVELPKRYMARHWQSILVLLGPVMLWGWLVTALFLWALVPGLDYLTALVVAAAVTPTDPILSASVVGGAWAEKHVPAHIRHLLTCESGCNDGAAFPFLYLAMYLTQNRHDVGWAIGRWVYQILLWEIALGTVIGAVVGWVARKVIRLSERWRLVDRESFVVHYVALALLSVGINVLLGSDDLLAAFAAGTAFAWDGWFDAQTESSNFSAIVDLLFNTATFVYLGAMMPFSAWVAPDTTLNIGRLFAVAVLTILTKRIPIIVALWKLMPDVKTFRDALFVGHFGPMGCGAIFIATLGRTLLPDATPAPPTHPNHYLANAMVPITYFLVLCSIAVHGLTVPFFSAARTSTKKLTESLSHGGLSTTATFESWSNRAFDRFRTYGSEKYPAVARPARRTAGARHSSTEADDTAGGMDEIRRILASQLPAGQRSLRAASTHTPRRSRSRPDQDKYPGVHEIRRVISAHLDRGSAHSASPGRGRAEAGSEEHGRRHDGPLPQGEEAGARASSGHEASSAAGQDEDSGAGSASAAATTAPAGSVHGTQSSSRVPKTVTQEESAPAAAGERGLLTPPPLAAAAAVPRRPPLLTTRSISFARHDTFGDIEDAAACRDRQSRDPGTGEWGAGTTCSIGADDDDAHTRRIRQHAYLTRRAGSPAGPHGLRREQPPSTDRTTTTLVGRLAGSAGAAVHRLGAALRGRAASRPGPSPLQRMPTWAAQHGTARADGAAQDVPGTSARTSDEGSATPAAEAALPLHQPSSAPSRADDGSMAYSTYPTVREWVEDADLVLEYQPSRLAEAVVSVIPLTPADRATWASGRQTARERGQPEPSPAWTWVQNHCGDLEAVLPHFAPHAWTQDTARFALIEYNVPDLLAERRRDRLDRQVHRRSTSDGPSSARARSTDSTCSTTHTAT